MAAQDAELKLKVSLDLGFFRQQLAGLGQAAAGYNMPINVKFDRQSITRELNNLQRAIKRGTYRIEIGGNIDTLPDKIKTLKTQLASLESEKIDIGVGAVKSLSKRDAQSVKRELRQGILGEDKKIFIPVSITPSITNADVADFRKAVREKLSGISVKVKADVQGAGFAGSPQGAAGLMEYMRTQGMVGKTASSMEMRMRNEGQGGRIQRSALDQLARAIFFMAGIDPAAVRAQVAQRRALPGINFPATVPPRNVSIGPSSTGRALPQGAIASALPGTAFGSQRYLPTGLSDELKRILRGAAFAFVDSIKQQVRTVRVSVVQSLLGPSRVAGLLPPSVGRTPSTYSTGRIGGESREELFARRTREAYMRSAFRGMDVMGGGEGRPPSPYSYAYRGARPLSAIVPYAAGGAIVPAGGGGGRSVPPSGGGGGAFGGAGGFASAMGNIRLPGTGTIREIGSEFANATKQVLLFGTAYKALAFVMSFPAQVGQAVGALQSFNNTLKAISPSAQEARASNELILSLVERYNIPLQSARDGFTKLYASMQPAGFSGDEVRTIFTGISKAAAAFGMSADKVDRVNYAFAQMASKGQVMSEELKGQLGDVLPGAMAIFAEAAGFKGPDAIQKFSKALEDGAYKGEAMKVLLQNVGTIMNQEFGPGAEGAARTFQGAMNRIQNSMALLYESFEPVAVGFLNSVVTPLTSGIKTITDGFNAFFTGSRAQTAQGFAFAQALESLRPAFEGIRANVTQLLPTLQGFGRILLEVGKVFLQIAANPFVGYMARVYLNVLMVTTAIQLLNLRALIPLIASFARSAYALIGFTVQCAKAGQSAQVMGLMVRTAGITLRTFFATTGVGLVIVGISMLIEKFMSMNQALEDTKNKALGAAQAIRSMSQTEARAAEQQAARDVKLLQQLSQQRSQGNILGDKYFAPTAEQKAALERAGVTTSRIALEGGGVGAGVETYRLRGAIESRQGTMREAEYRQRQLRFEEQQSQAPISIPSPTGGTGAGGGAAAKAKAERESQLPMLQLELDKAKELFAIERQIASAQLSDNAALVSSLELQKALVEIQYQGKQINIESIPDDEKRAKIAALRVQYEKTILESQLQLQITLQKNREEIQKSIEERVAGYLEENKYQEKYYNLVRKGIVPELAKLQVEIEKKFDVEKKRLDQEIEKLEVQKAATSLTVLELEAQKNLSEVDQLRLKDLRERLRLLDEELQKLGLLQTGLPAGQQQATAAAEKGQAIKPSDVRYKELVEESKKSLMELMDPLNQLKTITENVTDAIGNAFKQLIMGSASLREVLAGVFQGIAESFADMAAQMISEWLFLELVTGIGKMFNFGVPVIGAANGAVFQGGFQAFANGGIVTGPTLGLVGEGRYNEAVVPLPDGKSIPVDFGGAVGGQAVNNIVVHVDAKGSSVEGNEQEGRQLGRVVAAAVQQEIVKQKRPGGLLV